MNRMQPTVIGRAPKREALSKLLGRSILVTGPVAARLDRTLEPLGEHLLRGLARPMSFFSPGR